MVCGGTSLFEIWRDMFSPARSAYIESFETRLWMATLFGIQVHDRMLAVLGGCATTVGMICALQLGGERLAWKHAQQMHAKSPDNKPTIQLTPWVGIPMRPPSALTGTLILSVAAKALSYPNHRPISQLVPLSEAALWQLGVVFFGAAAYMNYVT